MEVFEQQILLSELPFLIKDTTNFSALKLHLLSHHLLRESDVHEIDQCTSDSEKYKVLYIAVMKSKYHTGFSKLLTCLNESGNEKIVDRLSYHQKDMEREIKLKGCVFELEPLPEYFTGRENELDKIKKFLSTRPNLVITGESGIGKSSMISKYATSSLENGTYTNVIWLNAEYRSTIEDSCRRLAGTKLCIKLWTDGGGRSKTMTQIMAEVYEKLESRPTLIIFDNAGVNMADCIKELIPGLNYPKNFHSIVTTAVDGVGIQIMKKRTGEFNKLNLDSFTVPEAYTLIGNILKLNTSGSGTEHPDPKIENCIQDLCNALDNYPLALRMAGSCIKECSALQGQSSKELAITSYTEVFKKMAAEYPTSLPRYQVILDTVWKFSFKMMRKMKYFDQGVDVMELLAFLSPLGIKLSLLTNTLQSDEDCHQILNPMKRFAIYRISEDGKLIIHRALQNVIRRNIEELGRTKQVIQRALTFVNEKFECESVRREMQTHALFIYESFFLKPQQIFQELIAEFSHLPTQLARSLLDNGNYLAASDFLKNLLPQLEVVLGEEHNDTILAKLQVARTIHGSGKFKEAEILFRLVYQSWAKRHGEDDPLTLYIWHQIGFLRYRQGDYKVGLEILRAVRLVEKLSKSNNGAKDHIMLKDSFDVVTEAYDRGV